MQNLPLYPPGVPCGCWQDICLQQLPSVFSPELTYYQQLCKIRGLLKQMLEENKKQDQEIAQIQEALNNVEIMLKEWEAGGKEVFLKWLKESFPQLVYFGLTDSGYFVAYLPEEWTDIIFGTTGLDMETELEPEYGHLTIRY